MADVLLIMALLGNLELDENILNGFPVLIVSNVTSRLLHCVGFAPSFFGIGNIA